MQCLNYLIIKFHRKKLPQNFKGANLDFNAIGIKIIFKK